MFTPMITDPRTIDVLLPLALEGVLSYSIPDGLALAPGDFVEVPLGSRSTIGVVWNNGSSAASPEKLRPVTGKFDIRPLTELNRRFFDWVAAYYLEPPGNVLRMALRAPGALDSPRQQI